MYFGDGSSGVAYRVYPLEVYVGVVEEQADEFAGGVSGAADDCGFDHFAESVGVCLVIIVCIGGCGLIRRGRCVVVCRDIFSSGFRGFG